MPIQADEKKPVDAKKCLIIGGGVMGLSTAWYLLKEGHRDVCVIDHPDRLAPSRDISKFVRIDYMDPDRMKFVMKSKSLWKHDQLFKLFFHPTGRIVAYPPSQLFTLNGIDRARLELGLPARKHQSAEFLERWYNSTPTSEYLEVVHNEDDGIVDWDGVMKKMKQDCIDMGGKFEENRVLRLESDQEGVIHTIVMSSDRFMSSDTYLDTRQTDIILAVGPWMMQLLQDSNIHQPPLSRQPIATGIFVFQLTMSDEQWAHYSRLPPYCEIGFCEFVCHPTDVGVGKVTMTKAFRNPSGPLGISVPRYVAGSDLAIKTKLDARDWVRYRIPGLEGARIRSTRSYWDGVTANQKPIIARHPNHANLIIAGGGSYTHAKDLPYIGYVITEVLLGGEIQKEFGWEESFDEKQLDNQPSLKTNDVFDDLELQASKDQRVED